MEDIILSYTGACSVSWDNVILTFGGVDNMQGTYKFDPSNDQWTILKLNSPPLNICNSGCVVLPDNNVLIAGANTEYYTYAVFNVTSSTWVSSGSTQAVLSYSVPLIMGSRVFIMPKESVKKVVEYVVSNNTFVPADDLVLDRMTFYGAITVPAAWFAHLPGGCQGVN